AMSRRAVSKPSPLFAPVISVVVMNPDCGQAAWSASGPVFLGLPVPGRRASGRCRLVGMATTEFGQALRRWRDRVSPAAAGVPAGGPRRARGLRREELALLAAISVDYVTRLEQGRAANPSTQVVEALARALRLSGTERAHLFRLAGLVPPGPETVPAYITPSVQPMLDRLTGTPVSVYDATVTLL